MSVKTIPFAVLAVATVCNAAIRAVSPIPAAQCTTLPLVCCQELGEFDGGFGPILPPTPPEEIGVNCTALDVNSWGDLE